MYCENYSLVSLNKLNGEVFYDIVMLCIIVGFLENYFHVIHTYIVNNPRFYAMHEHNNEGDLEIYTQVTVFMNGISFNFLKMIISTIACSCS